MDFFVSISKGLQLQPILTQGYCKALSTALGYSLSQSDVSFSIKLNCASLEILENGEREKENFQMPQIRHGPVKQVHSQSQTNEGCRIPISRQKANISDNGLSWGPGALRLGHRCTKHISL